jgi:nitroreductase
MDEYQRRYLDHQEKKAKSLMGDRGILHKPYTKKETELFFKILKNRISQRVFSSEEISKHELDQIETAIRTAPSSCNRKGVFTRTITRREDKEVLSGLLVGGVGWAYRGQAILLLIADMRAYKNPTEQSFMPYLDAGVIIQTTYLTCEALSLGCCYINPNIRDENERFFNSRFNIDDNLLFCGALVLGK